MEAVWHREACGLAKDTRCGVPLTVMVSDNKDTKIWTNEAKRYMKTNGLRVQSQEVIDK
jgi:hypothetical protein